MTPLTKQQRQKALVEIADTLKDALADFDKNGDGHVSTKRVLAGAKAILNHGNPLRSMVTELLAWGYVMRIAYREPDLAYLASELAKEIAERLLGEKE